jgi:hypothetical protein
MSISLCHPIHNVPMRAACLNDCWAHAVAMMLGRGSEAGVEAVRQRAARAGVTFDSTGVSPSSVSALARAVHLNHVDYTTPARRAPSLRELARLLAHGPVVVLGLFTVPGQPNPVPHAVTVFGLRGDGSDRGTEVSAVNPADGATFRDDFEHFITGVVRVDYILARSL